jgi:hypothetical protein
VKSVKSLQLNVQLSRKVRGVYLLFTLRIFQFLSSLLISLCSLLWLFHFSFFIRLNCESSDWVKLTFVNFYTGYGVLGSLSKQVLVYSDHFILYVQYLNSEAPVCVRLTVEYM